MYAKLRTSLSVAALLAVSAAALMALSAVASADDASGRQWDPAELLPMADKHQLQR